MTFYHEDWLIDTHHCGDVRTCVNPWSNIECGGKYGVIVLYTYNNKNSDDFAQLEYSLDKILFLIPHCLPNQVTTYVTMLTI